MTTLMQSLHTLLRHRWRDESDARRTLPPEAMERLKQRVAASERRHTGQIRIAVEAGLPPSYLWRHHGATHTPARSWPGSARVMMFSKLGVWDTERNNGVLIYLLLAEQPHRDRGRPGHPRGSPAMPSGMPWSQRMAQAFAGRAIRGRADPGGRRGDGAAGGAFPARGQRAVVR
jgi:hypothetical protein